MVSSEISSIRFLPLLEKKLEAEIMETYQQHLALMEAETEAAQHAQHV